MITLEQFRREVALAGLVGEVDYGVRLGLVLADVIRTGELGESVAIFQWAPEEARADGFLHAAYMTALNINDELRAKAVLPGARLFLDRLVDAVPSARELVLGWLVAAPKLLEHLLQEYPITRPTLEAGFEQHACTVAQWETFAEATAGLRMLCTRAYAAGVLEVAVEPWTKIVAVHVFGTLAGKSPEEARAMLGFRQIKWPCDNSFDHYEFEPTPEQLRDPDFNEYAGALFEFVEAARVYLDLEILPNEDAE
jgi:hypothetical protein